LHIFTINTESDTRRILLPALLVSIFTIQVLFSASLFETASCSVWIDAD
jgi:hypothetical protein